MRPADPLGDRKRLLGIRVVREDGGPVTFSSGPLTVRRGERVKLTPASWRSLDRVKATSSTRTPK